MSRVVLGRNWKKKAGKKLPVSAQIAKRKKAQKPRLAKKGEVLR